MTKAIIGKRSHYSSEPNAHSGMTLVELLAALAIASVVLVAALTVTATLTRAEAAAKQGSERSSILEGLRRVLAMDLAHAERSRSDKTGFSLQTHAALDGALEVTHVPAEVAYRVVDTGGRRWLVRSQQALGGKQQSELLAANVEGIELLTGITSANVSDSSWRPLPANRPLMVAISRSGSGLETFRFVGREK